MNKYEKAARYAYIYNEKITMLIEEYIEQMKSCFGIDDVTPAFMTMKSVLTRPVMIPAFIVATPSKEAVYTGETRQGSVYRLPIGNSSIYEIVKR